jgi:hypothetical protein
VRISTFSLCFRYLFQVQFCFHFFCVTIFCHFSPLGCLPYFMLLTYFCRNLKNQRLFPPPRHRLEIVFFCKVHSGVNFINLLVQGTNAPTHKVGVKRCWSITSVELCPTLTLQRTWSHAQLSCCTLYYRHGQTAVLQRFLEAPVTNFKEVFSCFGHNLLRKHNNLAFFAYKIRKKY